MTEDRGPGTGDGLASSTATTPSPVSGPPSAMSVQGVSKRYRKGVTGYRTLREDLYTLTGRLFDFGGEKKRDVDSQHMWALRDVSFEVKPGERVGIIGRNGSGKTTLLRLLAGVTRPTRGTITVRGRMGVLIEIMAGFHPELTGRENIYLNGAIMGMSRREIAAKFDEIVAFSEIEDWIDTPIKRYSSGMHVRLGFAVAAHLDPEVLLVDEVLAVGDAAFQQKCMGKMDTAAQEGRTVVFVSHNMISVSSLCDRCILMDEGQVQSDGPADEVIESYLCRFRQSVSQEVPGVYDLSERTNPYLPGSLIIRGMKLLNSQGAAQGTFPMGQELKIVVQVEGLSDYSDSMIGAIIKSGNDQRLAGINTAMSCSHVDQPRHRRETAILQVPRIPFVAGSYWIDLSVTRGNSGRIDYVDRAGQFSVVEADVYGTGSHVGPGHGIVFLEGTWEIRRDDR